MVTHEFQTPAGISTLRSKLGPFPGAPPASCNPLPDTRTSSPELCLYGQGGRGEGKLGAWCFRRVYLCSQRRAPRKASPFSTSLG